MLNCLYIPFDTMEFQYESYFVRLVLNPTDIILRLEHKQTARIYEQTFFDRDFQEFQILGGLDFVGKAVASAFGGTKPAIPGLGIQKFQDSPAKVVLEIRYTCPLFPTPLTLIFSVPALRKQTGATDTERKLKDLSDAFEAKLMPLVAKVAELEERTAGCIVLPGCDYAIPTNLTCLTLCRNNTALPSGQYVSSLYPQMVCCSQSGNGPMVFNKNMPFGNPQNGWTNTWTDAPGTFAHSGLTNLKNLKYLRACSQLTLSGTLNLTDYSILGEMPWLTHLTIVSSRKLEESTKPVSYPTAGNNPPLTDLKWITALKNLHSLTLLGCNSLVDITPLKELPSLRILDIRETAVRNTDFLVNPHLTITK